MNRKFKILVVDDNAVFATGLHTLMKSAGYEVDVAMSGVECLNKAEGMKPDLILLDVMLPDIDGIEVCRRLRAHSQLRNSLIVHISASRSATEDQVAGLESGAHGYITLPVSNRELLARVNAMMRLKEVEEQLRDSERRHRILAEALPQLVWTSHSDGRSEFVNQHWTEYTGRSDFTSPYWPGLVHPEDVERTRKAWDEASAERKTYDVEHRLLGCDGRFRWFKTRAVPMAEESIVQLKWFGTCTDITDTLEARETLRENQKRLEAKVEERTAELRETVKQLEAFSYTIAHDLRAPLRAISCFADIIHDDFSEGLAPEGQDYLKRISTAGRRLEILIQDLLGYARMARQEMVVSPSSLEDIVVDILRIHEEEINERKATVELRGPWHPVLANRNTLVDVISHLVSNALKFAKEGISPKIEIWSELRDGFVRLFVRDNGIGIAQEHHSKLFNVFEKLHPTARYSGSGVGLAIVRKGIERMGGKVGVTSAVDEGSCFWVELPHTASAAA